MDLPVDLNALSPEQLRALATQLIARVGDRDREIEEKTREVGEKERELRYRQTRIDQLTHEISILRRYQFGRRSEQLSSDQMNRKRSFDDVPQRSGASDSAHGMSAA
jgi:TolA-binding protein